MEKERKSGSGRPKGAVSLVSIPMKKLKESLKDEDVLVVGRIWAKKSGLSGTLPAIKAPLTEDEKAGIKIVVID